MFFQGRVPKPNNEKVLSYAPGSSERKELKEILQNMRTETREIPLCIGGKSHNGRAYSITVRSPQNHNLELAEAAEAGPEQIEQAIHAALLAKNDWARLPFQDRARVFLRAAELLAGPYRAKINAATMLGQGKTAHQAEIDSACELIDFLRFNVFFVDQIEQGDLISPSGIWNSWDTRPLDGFVFAITPFNFTAIAGNLPTAPAILGNTVLWKPAQTQLLSASVIMDVLNQAGLPPGVINLVSGDSEMISRIVLGHRDLGAIHFTGSTRVFHSLFHTVGQNIAQYRQYPRLVGETGGKDFIFAHPSITSDIDQQALITAIVRGGFEYQGQKCSAASRIYIPKSVWKTLKDPLIETTRSLRMGDPEDFRNFMGAVIDERAYKKITEYQNFAKADSNATILSGGEAESHQGWFIQPTLVELKVPDHRLMTEEIFGPIVSIFVFEDERLEEALDHCEGDAPYALTGALFSNDRAFIRHAGEKLRFAAGNFYINDKPTGAVVGQQPFGGSRGSGTNDKAGSPFNLMRFISPRVIKECFVPPTSYSYPFMSEDDPKK